MWKIFLSYLSYKLPFLWWPHLPGGSWCWQLHCETCWLNWHTCKCRKCSRKRKVTVIWGRLRVFLFFSWLKIYEFWNAVTDISVQIKFRNRVPILNGYSNQFEGRALQIDMNLLRCLHYTWLCDNMRPLYMCERFMLVEVSRRPSKGMRVCIVSMENCASEWCCMYVWSLYECECVFVMYEWAINESSSESSCSFYFFFLMSDSECECVFMLVLYTSVSFWIVSGEHFDCWIKVKLWEHVIFLN